MSKAAQAAIAGGLVSDEISNAKSEKQLTNARHSADAQTEDRANRREATYRSDRTMLSSAIDQYYKKQGWEVPEKLPGFGTSKQLPFEKPLYTEGGAANRQPLAPKYEEEAQGGAIAASPMGDAQAIVNQAPAPQVAPPAVPDVSSIGAQGNGEIKTVGAPAVLPPQGMLRPLYNDGYDASRIIGRR